MLEVLMRNAGRVVGKNEISEQALGRPLARFDRTIDVHLSAHPPEARRRREP